MVIGWERFQMRLVKFRICNDGGIEDRKFELIIWFSSLIVV